MPLIAQKLCVILFCFCTLFGTATFGQTNTWDGSASTNWNTAANWSLNIVPTAAHDVVIPNGEDVNINTAAVCNSFIIQGGGTDNNIAITGTNSLTVTNGVTIEAGTGNNDIKVLNVGAGTLTCNSITMDAGGFFNRGTEFIISTGTVNVSGDIIIGDGGGTGVNDFTFTGAGTLNVGGSFSGGVFTAGTGTVNYNGASQTIGAYVYNNLTLSGTTGTKTVEGALDINGDFTLGGGFTFIAGTLSHTLAGDWINNGATLNLTGSTIILDNAGAQSIGGSNATTFDNLSLSGSGTKTFNFSTTINDQLSIGSGVIADMGSFDTHMANSLALASVGQPSGSYGATGSGAVNENDTYFAGTGFITTIADGGTIFYLRQTGDWNSAATWSTVTYGDATNSSGSFPQAGDIVNIGGTSTLTVNVNSSCRTLIFQEDANASPTVNINSGITLDVSESVVIPTTDRNAQTNTLNVNDGTLSAASIAFEGGGFFGRSTLSIAGGTVIVTGDITADRFLLTDRTNLTFSAGGLLEIGGDLFAAESGTFNPGTGTVDFNGSSSQSVGDHTYYDLRFSGSGNKTPVGAITITNDIFFESGTSFTAGNFTHNISGDWTNNGATLINTGSTFLFNGTIQSIGGVSSSTFNNLTIDATSTTTLGLPTTINATLNIIAGGEADLGVDSHTAKTLSFDGAGQSPDTWGSTLSGAPSTNDVFFTSTSTGTIDVTNVIYYTRQTGNWNANTSWSTVTYGNATNTGTFPITGDIAKIGGNVTITVTAAAECAFIEYESGTGNTNTLTINAGITLDVADAFYIPSDGETNSINVGQGVLTTQDFIFSPAFGDVTTLTIGAGSVIINGDLMNIGPDFFGLFQETAFITFTGAGILQLYGTSLDTSNGDLTAGSGTVEYLGTSSQTIGDFTYNNLLINNSSGSSPQLTLAGDITVNTTLQMVSGIINLNGNTLTLGTSGNTSTLFRTPSTTTNWLYNGTFTRFWPAGATVTSGSLNSYGLFPVGSSTSSSYRPLELNSTASPTGTGSMSLTHTNATTISDLSPFYDDGGVDIIRKHDAQFVLATTVTGGTYDIDVTMTDLTPSGDVTSIRLAKSAGGTTVTTVGTHAVSTGFVSNPTASRTGVTMAELAGDWRITTTDPATPLPVELISFNGQLDNNKIQLKWITASELNNSHFEILRSVDGLTFQKISTVKGNGTTSQLQQYEFEDRHYLSGSNYYRLKQVDYDGAFELSEIIRVNADLIENVNLSLYPNPFVDVVTVDLKGIDMTQGARLTITDYSGNLLIDQKVPESTRTLQLSELSTILQQGIYIITVRTNYEQLVSKLIYKP